MMPVLRLLTVVLVSLVVAVPSFAVVNAEAEQKPIKVLVLTGGGYHDFSSNTATLLQGLLESHEGRFEFHWASVGQPAARIEVADVKQVELADSAVFNRYDVILGNHQGVLSEFTDEIKKAFLRYVHSGGGFVAIHSAADSHQNWDEYETMLGGRFESHPPFGEVSVQVDIAEHEITRDLPTSWTLNDEFYHLKNCATDDKLILMTGRNPGDAADAPLRPVTWERSYGAGRVFYTILGHGGETYRDERFEAMIARALIWSANAPRPDENGRYVLFDGTDMRGWSMAGPGRFELDNGELVARGGMGLLWYHERRFRDFTLSLEWKTEKLTDNSGVFVRFPQPSNDPWYAVRHGHEIQILDDPNAGELRGTGSIYAQYASTGTAQAAKPSGQWNRYDITVIGDSYTVMLNGEKILQWDSPTQRHGREGYIGIQNHDDNSPVRYRNISVQLR